MVICTPQGGGGDPVVLRKVHRYQVAGLVHRQGERETNHWRPTLWPNAVMGSRVARVELLTRGWREGQEMPASGLSNGVRDGAIARFCF